MSQEMSMSAVVGQWHITVSEDGGIRIWNPDPQTGASRFYEVVQGAFGAPVLLQEPDRGIDVPTDVSYVNLNEDFVAIPPSTYTYQVEGKEMTHPLQIVGFVCRGGHRGSMTNAISQGWLPSYLGEGEFVINGETWFLAGLHSPDKNRLLGYVAVLSKFRTNQVIVTELGDIAQLLFV